MKCYKLIYQTFQIYQVGIKYILLAIDIFTRKAFAQPLKNKSALTVVKGFEEIIKDTKPKIIQCDQGKEFINTEFRHL